ncbi:hypothetical protein AVEN_186071-1 [Araneus ventricosus]|uniref:Uncharacterized protein n=1 Tax=Araneus ventricosus TaxID=182803 RepID=A0A4Y2UA27_ARAVE|nr:hypothetical protein AVEN_11599-1 [Araneus ventricosus]GBO09678.1 hypothetical protein AVEN_186071-1 [Araneus ventricosus]
MKGRFTQSKSNSVKEVWLCLEQPGHQDNFLYSHKNRTALHRGHSTWIDTYGNQKEQHLGKTASNESRGRIPGAFFTSLATFRCVLSCSCLSVHSGHFLLGYFVNTQFRLCVPSRITPDP